MSNGMLFHIDDAEQQKPLAPILVLDRRTTRCQVSDDDSNVRRETAIAICENRYDGSPESKILDINVTT